MTLRPDYRISMEVNEGIAGFVDPTFATRVHIASSTMSSESFAEIFEHERMHLQLTRSTSLGMACQVLAKLRARTVLTNASSALELFDNDLASCLELSWHGQEAAAMLAGYAATHTDQKLIGDDFDQNTDRRRGYLEKYAPEYHQLFWQAVSFYDVTMPAHFRGPTTQHLFANALGQFSLNTDLMAEYLAPRFQATAGGDEPLWSTYMGFAETSSRSIETMVRQDRSSLGRLNFLARAIRTSPEVTTRETDALALTLGSIVGKELPTADYPKLGARLSGTDAETALLRDSFNGALLRFFHSFAGIRPTYLRSIDVRRDAERLLPIGFEPDHDLAIASPHKRMKWQPKIATFKDAQ